MIKKGIFFLMIFILTIFAMLECKTFEGNYGFLDYCNILFCNTKTYPLYGRTNWNLFNLLFFLIILISGVYYISEMIYTYNKGFRVMALSRYDNYFKYLQKCLFQNFKQAFLFLSNLCFSLIFSLLIVDINAFNHISYVTTHSSVFITFSFLLYLVKVIIVLNIAELWLTYLVLKHKFEFIILIFIIFITILLFVDIIFGFSFITLTLSDFQVIYIWCYLAIYISSFLYIKKKIRSKEIW